ncbi:hypothetical protein DFH07DRAFT_781592 [Mycena maculata]|uniref:Uncharacterized protein n=1 Tax=Mycena maculata TaxID=230809 RepID=A0AAD7MSY0_9AGAR|nr:hypothetical protein DFH07DRAFT_781592 [Mycena maculata]
MGGIAGADESDVDGWAKNRAWQESEASTPGNLMTGAGRRGDESDVDGWAKNRAWQESEASTPGNLMTGAGRRGGASLHAGTGVGVLARGQGGKREGVQETGEVDQLKRVTMDNESMSYSPSQFNVLPAHTRRGAKSHGPKIRTEILSVPEVASCANSRAQAPVSDWGPVAMVVESLSGRSPEGEARTVFPF